MSTATLTFTPDGLGHGLYTEAIELSLLGRLTVNRATSIEYDNALQVWRVRDENGLALYTSPSRQTCLDWERQHFNTKEEFIALHARGSNAPADRPAD